MRIAVVTTSYPTHAEDPSGHFVRAEVRALSSAGHAVTVFAPRAKGRPREPGVRLVELPHLGLFGWPGALERVKHAPWSLLGVLPFVREARRKLEREGPFDERHVHWLLPGFWPICSDFGGVTLVVAHGSDVGLVERLPRTLQRRVLGALSQNHVRVRAVSSDLRARLERLAARCDVALATVHVEPAALELPTLPGKEELRRVLGVDAAPLVVVVGRVVKDKRLELAIEATLRAFGRGPTVIGDGPERASLMRRFPDAEWLGQLPRDATLGWIQAADVLLSASLHEGAPTAVREARLLGTPVVATRAGDLLQWAERDPELTVVDAGSREAPALLTMALRLTWARSAGSAASAEPSDEWTASPSARPAAV